jgi:ABC-2 type transport system permease protein
MFFLSGALFPLQGVPAWMEFLAKINPVTYGVDPLRQVALSENVSQAALSAMSLHPISTDVTIMAGLGVAFLVPAIWLFGKQD